MPETLTLEQARQAAREAALRTDAAYRAYRDRSEHAKRERQAKRAERRERNLELRSRRTHYVAGRPLGLPSLYVHVWLRGRHRPELMEFIQFVDDIRERVCEEIRPGVYAQWSDPLERLMA